MPQRPPSFAARLRSVLDSDDTATRARSAPPRHAHDYPGAEFADRLRAAVAARR